jgi:riboflavin synthase alpha subunit
MALSEDLSVFLTDFGVSCTSGAVTALGILDMPGQVLADGMVISTDYQLTAKASDFGALKYNDSISVDGVAYTVRDTRLIDDGRFCEVSLMKT